MSSSREGFLKPVLSTLGLIISFIVAFSPLFVNTKLTQYFANQDFAYISSILSAILGIAITWMVITFYRIFYVNIRGIVINPQRVAWSLMLLSLFLFGAFFLLSKSIQPYLQVSQAIVYILFFDVLIAIFAILFGVTKSNFDYSEERELFPTTLYETLENNRLVTPGIAIFDNDQLSYDQLKALDVNHFGIAKKIKLQTIVQQRQHLEVIVTGDGKELLKVIKRQELNDDGTAK